MKSLKRIYYYFFYKLYKFWDYISVPKFWSEWKAGISIVALELWSVFTALNYYDIINNSKEKLSLTSPVILIPLLIIIILNYIAFDYYDYVWKKYNIRFDNLPKRKNMIGGIIVWTIILFIIIAFFTSTFYLHKTIYGTY